MSVFKSIAQNTLFQLLSKIFTIIFSLVTTYFLTRKLGQAGYGDYTFLSALILLFGTISDWGTNIISVREASIDENNRSTIFGSTTIFRFLLSLAALVLVNILVGINGNWQYLLFSTLIGSLVLLALSLKTSFGIIFQTHLRFDLTALMEITSTVLFCLLVLFSLYFGFGLSGVMASWFIATLVSALVGYILSLKIIRISWVFERKVIKRIFVEALPAGALFIFFTIYNRIDIVFLQYFWGSTAVAPYGLAYKIHDNLVLGAAFLMNSLFPYFSKNFADINKRDLLRKQYQKAFDLLFLGAVAIFLFFFVFAPFIINLLGGQDYSNAVGVLRILLVATIFAYFNHLTGYSLLAFGRQKSSLAIALGALVFNVVANLFFVPFYSFTASAIITVVTEGLVLVLSSIVVTKTIGIKISLTTFPATLYQLIKSKSLDF